MSGSHLCYVHRWRTQLEICGVAWETIPAPRALLFMESTGKILAPALFPLFLRENNAGRKKKKQRVGDEHMMNHNQLQLSFPL